MPSAHAQTKARVSPALLGLCLLVSGLGIEARAEPPIRSPEDAACRLEARARVFLAPNPRGLELEVIGKQIYAACLQRLSGGPRPRPRHRHHRHRR